MKTLLTLLAMTSLTFAHTGTHTAGGFMTGFMHPIGGLDHILAMIGVGMVAYFATSKGYLTLAAFIGAMIVAAIAGYAGIALVGMEAGILISIAVVFGMVGFAHKLPIGAIAVIVAFFGMFHGFAHGAEFGSGSFVAYMGGFAFSTLILHLSGMALAYLYTKKLQPSLAK
jgi:urease accessory protein